MEDINNIVSPIESDETLNYKTDQMSNFPVKKPVNKKIVLLIIIGIIFLVTAVGVGAFYLGTKNIKLIKTEEKIIPTQENKQTALFSGSIKRLDQDLKLFILNEEDKLNNLNPNYIYYSAGVFNRGDLKDYTRIIAVRSATDPGGPLIFVLATKDFQTYILDNANSINYEYSKTDGNNPFYNLDKSKVSSTKVFENEQSKEINLNNNLSIYRKDYLTKSVETKQLDKLGNIVYEDILVTDFSSYQKLASPVSSLTFYFEPYEKNPNFDKLAQSGKDTELLEEKYFSGYTTVIVVDSSGLPLSYILTTPEKIKTYYEEKLSEGDTNYVSPPKLSIKNTEIQNKNNLNFYNTYDIAIPGACSASPETIVVANINDNDLEQVGLVSNISLYRLKDINHPLYKLAFNNKMDYYSENQDYAFNWDEVNNGIKKPTFEEYVAKNPLLFIKDYWQRWVVIGEYDINLPGGCGKPVIYLYPEKPTEVKVQFQAKVQFSTDIPKYDNYWQVLAQPNGSLKNLRPEMTDCSQIDSSKKGSEYASLACQKNDYPYLFWAGNIFSKKYPDITQGWIVEKNNLGKFLQTKLSEVGLNTKEKEDFISYWLPDMISKNIPYYRISFLQTQELNSLFPMTVMPRPDTIFRIFLDYLPLSEKPNKPLAPQTLNKFTRNGFTLVEWGGLKR